MLALPTNFSIVAMAKSAHNRSQKPDAQKAAGQSFIAVDKNAFDPTLSSLFEKSVRSHQARNFPQHSIMLEILTKIIVGPCNYPSKVALSKSTRKKARGGL
jgi:hypothetical protein